LPPLVTRMQHVWVSSWHSDISVVYRGRSFCASCAVPAGVVSSSHQSYQTVITVLSWHHCSSVGNGVGSFQRCCICQYDRWRMDGLTAMPDHKRRVTVYVMCHLLSLLSDSNCTVMQLTTVPRSQRNRKILCSSCYCRDAHVYSCKCAHWCWLIITSEPMHERPLDNLIYIR